MLPEYQFFKTGRKENGRGSGVGGIGAGFFFLARVGGNNNQYNQKRQLTGKQASWRGRIKDRQERGERDEENRKRR